MLSILNSKNKEKWRWASEFSSMLLPLCHRYRSMLATMINAITRTLFIGHHELTPLGNFGQL